MHPIIFHLGNLPVTSYGLFLSIAFAAGIVVARVRARARDLDGEIIVEVSILILVTSLLGSRLLFAVENPELFVPPEGSWSRLWTPFLKQETTGGMAGLSMSGGVVLAVGSTLLFLRHRGVSALRYADVLAPSVALGAAITRIGCFLNGCCHGVVCSYPWGVVFPAGSPAARAFGSVAVHPTQLYASLVNALLFGGLIWLAGTRGARARAGLVFFWFLVSTAGVRLALDTIRHYPADDRVYGPFYVHTPLVALLLLAGLLGLAALRRAPEGRENEGRGSG